MKGKRKRFFIKSPDDSFENPPSSSPDRSQNKPKDVCQTPDSKKPAICISPSANQSPADILEPKGRVTRARASRIKNGSEDVEDSENGKARGKGSKKQPKASKRQKRGKKTSPKQVMKDDDEVDKIEASPKRPITRNKRKQEETETHPAVTPKKRSSYHDEAPKTSPVKRMAKKSKLSVSLADEPPSSAEVFIPETPIIESNPKKMSTERLQADMSSLQVVLTPTSVAEKVVEISTKATEEEDKVISNPVLIVEATTYENQGNVSNKEPESQEQVISEPTVSSTKKTYRKTRSRSSRASSSHGTKRKQVIKDDDKPLEILSSTNNNEAELEESMSKMQKLEQSDSDNAVVSSTVSSPVKSQRKNTRLSRASTRRSSRLPMKAAQNQRKSKIRKSRSLVKSSVLLKLSTKKMMPSLTPDKGNDVVKPETSNTIDELDKVKTNLFEDQETNGQIEARIFPEICEAHSSTPSKRTSNDSTEENADGDVETEEEEFHDAHQSVEEIDGGEYHDASEDAEVIADEKDGISRYDSLF